MQPQTSYMHSHNRQITYTQPKETLSAEMPLHDYMNHWLNLVAKPYVKQSTFSLYRRMLDRHLAPALGHFRLCELNEQIIRTYVTEKLQFGRLDNTGGLSDKTVREHLCLLNSILKSATLSGLMDANPVRNIRRPKVQDAEMRVFTPREQRRIEKAVIELGGGVYLGITLCLYTGLRLGELCALKWRNVSFEHKTVTVTSTLQRIQDPTSDGKKTCVIIDTPKSRRSFRTLPLTGVMCQKLRNYYASLPAYRRTQDDFVFNLSDINGNRHIEPRLFEKYFQRVLRQANVKNANFHATRHTFATRCVEVNMDIKSLSEVLGHSTVSITLNKYVHSFMNVKRKSMAKLDSIIV